MNALWEWATSNPVHGIISYWILVILHCVGMVIVGTLSYKINKLLREDSSPDNRDSE